MIFFSLIIAVLEFVVRFFILNFSQPGTVPDNKMISQIFRLDSPLLCQAVVLTELIRFVRRCSTSWPKSMTDFGMTNHKSDEGGFSKDFFSRLSLSAGRNFYIWAESLAAELEELSRSDLQARMMMIKIIIFQKIF